VTVAPLPRVLALNKPRGVLVSTVPEAGATTVFALLEPPFDRWWCAGRLDKDTQGLLLLCDDPGWAQRLMEPDGVPKTYVATVRGLPTDEDLEPIRRGGALLDGHPLRPVEVRRLGPAPHGKTRFELVLREGRRRQIRRQLYAAGHRVRHLIRLAVGPVHLGDLAPGEHRELSRNEVVALLAELERQRS
jgi:pseudouridine synthase